MAAKKTATKTAKKTTKAAPVKAAAPVAKKAAKKAAPAKKAATKAATPAAPKITTDLIARAAYLNYRRRVEQGLPGDSRSDWLEAERQVSKS